MKSFLFFFWRPIFMTWSRWKKNFCHDNLDKFVILSICENTWQKTFFFVGSFFPIILVNEPFQKRFFLLPELSSFGLSFFTHKKKHPKNVFTHIKKISVFKNRYKKNPEFLNIILAKPFLPPIDSDVI